MDIEAVPADTCRRSVPGRRRPTAEPEPAPVTPASGPGRRHHRQYRRYRWPSLLVDLRFASAMASREQDLHVRETDVGHQETGRPFRPVQMTLAPSNDTARRRGPRWRGEACQARCSGCGATAVATGGDEASHGLDEGLTYAPVMARPAVPLGDEAPAIRARAPSTLSHRSGALPHRRSLTTARAVPGPPRSSCAHRRAFDGKEGMSSSRRVSTIAPEPTRGLPHQAATDQACELTHRARGRGLATLQASSASRATSRSSKCTR